MFAVYELPGPAPEDRFWLTTSESQGEDHQPNYISSTILVLIYPNNLFSIRQRECKVSNSHKII